MRCEKARRWLSDDLDGALGPARKARLAVHLSSCHDCRAYRDDLVRLEATAGRRLERSADDWAAFERRLEARLDAEARNGPVGRVLEANRRAWAWPAVASAAAAALILWLALGRPLGDGGAPFGGGPDSLASLIAVAETDPDIGERISERVERSIREMTGGWEGRIQAAAAEDPLFWESLSDEELERLAVELAKDIGGGGAK